MKKAIVYRVFLCSRPFCHGPGDYLEHQNLAFGVSPIIFGILVSDICNFNFNATFVYMETFIIKRDGRPPTIIKGGGLGVQNPSSRLKLVLLLILLQFLLSLVFTRFMNLFAAVIPDFLHRHTSRQFAGSFWARLIVLLIKAIKAYWWSSGRCPWICAWSQIRQMDLYRR